MILKNKLTKKKLDIPYSEFRIKFAKEIQRIFGRAPCERKRTQPVRCRSDVTPPAPPNNPRRMRLKVTAKHN